MKLKCNVCKEGSVVEVTGEPNHKEDLICCPSCDKQMAFAMRDFDWSTGKDVSGKLFWHPIDYTFNKSWGGIPVEILAK